jgi:hypothetical protein
MSHASAALLLLCVAVTAAAEQKGGNINPARKRVASRRYHMNPDDLPPYVPCKCVGPCRPETCSCIKSNNWCEKFCACVGCKTRDCT